MFKVLFYVASSDTVLPGKGGALLCYHQVDVQVPSLAAVDIQGGGSSLLRGEDKNSGSPNASIVFPCFEK